MELLIKILSRYNSTIVLDNIHHTNLTKEITNKFLQLSNKIYFDTTLKIILVAQYDIEQKENTKQTYFDIFFDKYQHKINKNDICYIELSDKNNLYKIRYSMINNLISYYKKKGIISNIDTDSSTIENIEGKFGCLLIYLKYAIEYTKDLNSIEPKQARKVLKAKYSIMLDMIKNNNFKLILLYYSANNIPFKIDKDNYIDNYYNEEDLIELLINEKLIYKLDFENYFILSFPHTAIPKLILTILEKRNNIKIETIVLDNLSYLYKLDKELVISYIDYLIADQNIYTLDCAIQKLQQLNINFTTIFTAKRLLQSIAILNLGLVKIKFINEIKKIIVPQNLDFKNLSLKDLSDTFKMIDYTIHDLNYIKDFIDIYISNKNILFDNIDFTLQLLNYYSPKKYYEPREENTKIFDTIIDKILNNEQLFLKKLSAQYNLNILLNIFIVENDNLTSIISDNLLNILTQDKLSLEDNLKHIKLLYDLHNQITTTNLFIDIINEIILHKIDHDNLLKDLKKISDYSILVELFSLEYLSKKDDNVLELIDSIYNSLIDLDEQKYILPILRSVFDSSNTPFADYINIVHNINIIYGFKHSSQIIDIINLDLNIPEYILHNEDTFKFIKNTDIKLLDELKLKVIQNIAKSISYIKAPLNATKYKVLLNYSKNNSKENFDIIFNQFEQSIKHKLSKTTYKDIDYSAFFEFFVLANLYKKDVYLLLKEFINLFSINNNKDKSAYLKSTLVSSVNTYIELFNSFIIYLQDYRQEYILFIKFFIESIVSGGINLIYTTNLRKNPMNLSSLFYSIYLYNSKDIIDSLELNTNNDSDLNLKDKLAQYVLFDILKKDIPKIEDIDKLSQYKKTVHSIIEDTTISTTYKFLYLKGLLLIANNKEFIDKLKRDDIITDFKGKDYTSNRKDLLKAQQIICDKIKKDFTNLEFTK